MRTLYHLQFSLQDNGSAKYFQGAMHTPNMGEKVAQVSEIILYRNNWAMLRFENYEKN